MQIVEDFLDDIFAFPNIKEVTYPWTRHDGSAPDGNLGYMKSANKGIGSSSSFLIFKIDVPVTYSNTRLEIDHSVSSERNWDYFEIVINGTRELKSSSAVVGGPIVSGTFTKVLLPGTYNVELKYVKDGSANAGADEAYVSEIRLMYDEAAQTKGFPNVSTMNVNRSKISDEPGINQSVITIQFDKSVTEYRAMLNGTDYNTGVMVHSGGAVLANTDTQIIIDWNESLVEGLNRINIYGKNDIGWTAHTK